jgi:hypothetical protein
MLGINSPFTRLSTRKRFKEDKKKTVRIIIRRIVLFFLGVVRERSY